MLKSSLMIVMKNNCDVEMNNKQVSKLSQYLCNNYKNYLVIYILYMYINKIILLMNHDYCD